MIDDMAVYIANLGKYNEGYLVGAWFTFPIDEEDVKEKIGLNEQYEEYAIHDTDNFPIAIGEYVSIEELNEMYEMIEELPDYIVECLDEFISHYGTLEEVVEHKDDIYYYRFFLGFKLMVTEEQLNLKNIKKSTWLTFTEFLHEVNHTLMNDFVSMPNDEINRYMKMEKLLENKISRRFKVRRLEINDFGYLMEHLYGRDGIAYEDYEYQLPKKKLKKETLIKYYDLIRPTRCVIEESQRYLRLEHEDKESYVSYFTVNAIVGELDFPSSEIFYFQQQQFTFPVDTSMNVEIVENRKAFTTVRNKKKELKDLDNHAYQAGSETSSNVVDALDSVDELETDLDQSKESMYKLSYVIRVSAPDLDELKRRCDEVKDFYDDLNVKLVRPAGDMLGLHSEFFPASKRYINDYVQYVKSDFLAGLGFGATQQLGETTGIYMGYSVDTGRNVYLQPSLASQGVKGTVTNALASAFVGSLGGGKSFCNNLLVYYSVLFGGQAVILDPKSGAKRSYLKRVGTALH